MTTMNNTMNITNNTDFAFLKVTVVNGYTFELQLEVDPLTKEELNPVLDCLVNGTLDPNFDTPKVNDYIQNVLDSTVEVILRSCFDGRKYNHFYAFDLISATVQAGLCCEDCGVRFFSNLHQLYVAYLEDSDSVVREIAQSLYEFFANTIPFVFDVL